MFSKGELLDAIEELEESPATYQNAEKLATFYTLYDHLYIHKEPISRVETVREILISNYGDTEFYKAISDKNPEYVWSVMNELMSTVQVVHPRLYQATLEKIKGQ